MVKAGLLDITPGCNRDESGWAGLGGCSPVWLPMAGPPYRTPLDQLSSASTMRSSCFPVGPPGVGDGEDSFHLLF